MPEGSLSFKILERFPNVLFDSRLFNNLESICTGLWFSFNGTIETSLLLAIKSELIEVRLFKFICKESKSVKLLFILAKFVAWVALEAAETCKSVVSIDRIKRTR